MKQSTWSEDRVAQLKKLYEDGLSCSQIAAELGQVTRNAVIGKLHRLGLANSRSKAVRESRGPKQRRGPAPPPRRQTIIRQVLAQPYEPAPEKGDEAAGNSTDFDPSVPQDQRKGVLDLREGDCRWPIGDPATPDFYFCNGRALVGLPYCAHHTRLAYQPAQNRRGRETQEQRAARIQDHHRAQRASTSWS
ncbi:MULTISPECIES: GcrA family cell cycle regulator [unclassified Bradyrhizobium]|uniref:GcrA family cell cycle regulator n=1 Tax=Bradyrhizobium sp. USDA 4541 TaxID=2817704 RepID=UPI0020A50974|nr:GcrA family cell cycle regulator [Bradyrhizobium sp. USDA 4541]MCP1852851.1 GcrA cell cycle regulator [Bradyrhizobium sp. USDA 4541]